jgi:hypothetical protein
MDKGGKGAKLRGRLVESDLVTDQCDLNKTFVNMNNRTP